jgi:hypothetical protein
MAGILPRADDGKTAVSLSFPHKELEDAILGSA